MTSGGLFGYLSDYLAWWLAFGSIIVHTWCFFRFFPRQRHPRSGLVLGNGLMLLCFVGLAGIIGETYYRFVSIETDSFGVSLPARRWFAFHTELNSLGCRDAEWAKEKNNIRRIAFVGDSFTYGWGIEEPENRFADIIERRLAARAGSAIEVLNVAKPGWGTGDQIRPVEDITQRFGVDEVVLCYVVNDIEKLIPKEPGFDPTRPPEPSFFDPDRSALLDLLFRRLVVPRLPSVGNYHDWLAEGYADRAVWKKQQQLLHRLRAICKSNDARFRVALLPFMRSSGSKFIPERLHDWLGQFFRDNEIEFVDVRPATDRWGEFVVSQFDAHPNEEAHRIMADAIWDAFYSLPDG